MRDLRLVRPLKLGEVFDRGLSVFVGTWPSIIAAIFVAMAPRLLEHYYAAQIWLYQIGNRGEFADKTFSIATVLRVLSQLNELSPSSVTAIVSFTYSVFLFIAGAIIAAIVASKMVGRTIGFWVGLNLLSKRWSSVCLTAVLWTVGLLLCGYLTAMLQSHLRAVVPSSPTQLAILLVSRPIASIVLDIFQQIVFICGLASSVGAMLELPSTGEALGLGFTNLIGKSQLGRTIVLAAVYALIYALFGPSALFSTYTLYASLSSILYIVVDVAFGALPLSVILISGVIYYLDARLRRGLDLAGTYFRWVGYETLD